MKVKKSRRSAFEKLEDRKLYSTTLSTLPGPWADADIGATGKAGSATVTTNGSFAVAGSGADVWGAADAFNYAYQPLSGDGTVITQVTGETNTNGWAKAGVMIRTDLSTGSTFAFLFVSPQYGISFQARNVAKATPASAAVSVPGAIPKWVELVRTGQQVKGYYSNDGTNWTLDGQVTLPGNGQVYAGLAVCAHNNSALNTATFANTAVNAASLTATAPAAPLSLSATATSSTAAHLSWAPADINATSYVLQRKGPTDSTFVTMATPTSATTSFDDLTLSAAQTYQYQVMAVNMVGSSTFTPTSVTTPAAPVIVPPPVVVPPPVISTGVWTDVNIGAVGVTGTASTAGSVITVTGSGTDIWTAPDTFNFNEQTFVGNGSIVARMLSNSSTNSGSKAGIMFRETNATDSRYVDLIVTPNKTIQFQYRTATHNSSSYIATTGGAGTYLKLTRTGNAFTGAYSSDGVTWKSLGTATIPMVNNINVGMAVCSHNNVALATAKFDNVLLTQDGTQASIWTDAATAPVARWESAAVTYNNKLYVFGGFVDRTLDSTSESDVYDPSTNTWSSLTSIPSGGLTHAAATIVGNTLYLAGGDLGTFTHGKTLTATSQVLTYNFDTGVWGSIAPLPKPLASGGLVVINNVLYHFGGIDSTDKIDQSVTYAFDLNNPAAGWVTKSAMPDARHHFGYVVINNIAYAVGGQHGYAQNTGNDAEVDAFNPVTNTWTKMASLPLPLSSIRGSTFVVNGKIVVMGGQTNGGYDGIYQSGIWEYDPIANTWTSIGTMPEANNALSAVYLNGEFIGVDGTVDNQGGWAQQQTWTTDQLVLV